MNKVDTILKDGKIYTPAGWVQGGLAIDVGKLLRLEKDQTSPMRTKSLIVMETL